VTTRLAFSLGNPSDYQGVSGKAVLTISRLRRSVRDQKGWVIASRQNRKISNKSSFSRLGKESSAHGVRWVYPLASDFLCSSTDCTHFFEISSQKLISFHVQFRFEPVKPHNLDCEIVDSSSELSSHCAEHFKSKYQVDTLEEFSMQEFKLKSTPDKIAWFHYDDSRWVNTNDELGEVTDIKERYLGQSASAIDLRLNRSVTTISGIKHMILARKPVYVGWLRQMQLLQRLSRNAPLRHICQYHRMFESYESVGYVDSRCI
jgi:hypothetical protein